MLSGRFTRYDIDRERLSLSMTLGKVFEFFKIFVSIEESYFAQGRTEARLDHASQSTLTARHDRIEIELFQFWTQPHGERLDQLVTHHSVFQFETDETLARFFQAE